MPKILGYLACRSESTQHFAHLLAISNILTIKWQGYSLTHDARQWGDGLVLFLDNVCTMYSTEQETAAFVQAYAASLATVTTL